jgi:hypothetical protein
LKTGDRSARADIVLGHTRQGRAKLLDAPATCRSPVEDWDLSADSMAYEKPLYSLNQVDKAGDCLRNTSATVGEKQVALDVIYNWRSAHGFPLNSLHMTLRRRAKNVDQHTITAQRLKRIESIWGKLFRFQKMQASQMQDVGGCRAIVGGIKQLNALAKLYDDSPLRHELRPVRNYIRIPKVMDIEVFI